MQEVNIAKYELGIKPPKRRRNLENRDLKLKTLVQSYDQSDILNYLRKVAAFQKLDV